jgi:hypothetical protein
MRKIFKSKALIFGLFMYWIFVALGSTLSIPIQVIPDETSQLLNIYGMIQGLTFKLPYESYYTVWVHVSFLPFTMLYWGGEYILLGFPSIDFFKTHVAANYADVLPFLRVASALFFIITSWLVSKVIESRWGKLTAILFLIFLLSDLLVFINLHYSKHWIMDLSWIFLSIYLYWNYLNNGKKYLFFSSIILFCIGIYSSHPLILAGLYLFYLLLSVKPNSKKIVKDLFFATLIGLIFLLITIWLGPGKIISEIVNSGSTSQMSMDFSLVREFLISLFDYNPILSTIFIFSIVVTVVRKDVELFLLLIPFVGFILLIATFHYEPRYALFLVVSMSLVSAIVISKLNTLFLKIGLIGILIIGNSLLLLFWHSIAIEKDTRKMALEWILNETRDESFVVYNTLGFNYHPLSINGIKFMNDNFPNAIGTRERLYTSLNLPSGINGTILRKVDEGGYSGNALIAKLINDGYEPILINERFGKNAYFNQPSPSRYREILDNCRYDVKVKFLPYKYIPDNFERYGDILYNFTGVMDSLFIFDRPGPIITIYQFDKKQPETCS